jgi:L-threonylcarbamoyladenylate synthase
MSTVYDCRDTAQLLEGTREARRTLGRGALAVIPTDTVYGIAADAFSPHAVAALLDAKGRTRQAPPPVLIPGVASLDALAEDVPEPIHRVAETFWPGALTIILDARGSLDWDLGDTQGTVALRVPDETVARAVLEETGPLAVSSANRHGEPAATTVEQAREQLGDTVEVYLDDGPSRSGVSSTIIDATLFEQTGSVRIVRQGGVTAGQLAEVLGADAVLGLER